MNQATNHCGSEYYLQTAAGEEKSPNKPKTKPKVKIAQLTLYLGSHQGTEN